MTAVTSTDPRTGTVVATVADETTPDGVDRLCRAAADAAPAFEALGRRGRAELLRALADGLEADRALAAAIAANANVDELPAPFVCFGSTYAVGA